MGLCVSRFPEILNRVPIGQNVKATVLGEGGGVTIHLHLRTKGVSGDRLQVHPEWEMVGVPQGPWLLQTWAPCQGPQGMQGPTERFSFPLRSEEEYIFRSREHLDI